MRTKGLNCLQPHSDVPPPSSVLVLVAMASTLVAMASNPTIAVVFEVESRFRLFRSLTFSLKSTFQIQCLRRPDVLQGFYTCGLLRGDQVLRRVEVERARASSQMKLKTKEWMAMDGGSRGWTRLMSR